MDLEYLKKYSQIFVIGHFNPDLDTVVSSSLISSIFNYFGINAKPAFLNKNYEIDETSLLMMQDCIEFNPIIINEDDINNHYFFFVDHNHPKQSINTNEVVIGGIDHHHNNNQIPNLIVGSYACNALFIYSLFKNIYPFSNQEKKQIFYATLSDTKFYRSSRFKDVDKELLKELGYSEDANTLFNKYFCPTNLDRPIEEIFLNGYKDHQVGDVCFGSSYIEINGPNEKLKKAYLEFIKNKKEPFLGIWHDYLDKKTTAYFNYDNHIITFNYNEIASRAKEILVDITRYLEKK